MHFIHIKICLGLITNGTKEYGVIEKTPYTSAKLIYGFKCAVTYRFKYI